MTNELGIHFEQESKEALDLRQNFILCIIEAFYCRVKIAA